MSDEMRNLLLRIAGFLSIVSNGDVPTTDHARKEAGELLDKIGDVLAAAP